MSGGATAGAGQHWTGRQSAGLGQPALNENVTLDSCGSRPSGGSAMPGPATIARVYGAKSPVLSRLIVATSGSAAVAGSMDTTWGVVSPVTVMFAGVSPSDVASLRNVTASCVPEPGGPSTSR